MQHFCVILPWKPTNNHDVRMSLVLMAVQLPVHFVHNYWNDLLPHTQGIQNNWLIILWKIQNCVGHTMPCTLLLNQYVICDVVLHRFYTVHFKCYKLLFQVLMLFLFVLTILFIVVILLLLFFSICNSIISDWIH